MVKPNEKWDETRMVYCTGGKYPVPRKPEFSPRAGNLIGKYGCAHYKSDPCACRCHSRKIAFTKTEREIIAKDTELEYQTGGFDE